MDHLPSEVDVADLSHQDRETLKAIATRHTESTPVRPGTLVADLGLSPATVTGRLKRLDELGLVDHIPYGGVTLTALGARLAVAVVRRHRIVERFLVDLLEFHWEDAETLAPTFEHALPPEVVERLYERLGSPASCPHGFPIPAADAVEVPVLTSLADVEVGESAEIVIPSYTDHEAIVYLGELGVRPGVRVMVKEKLPFEGPLTIVVDGTEQTLGNKLARMLLVKPSPN
jgi:DtxR family transcriptional regulator, Mn-dependent transcriptional regulator